MLNVKSEIWRRSLSLAKYFGCNQCLWLFVYFSDANSLYIFLSSESISLTVKDDLSTTKNLISQLYTDMNVQEYKVCSPFCENFSVVSMYWIWCLEMSWKLQMDQQTEKFTFRESFTSGSCSKSLTSVLLRQNNSAYSDGIYLVKVNNRNTRTMYEIWRRHVMTSNWCIFC